MPVLHFEDDRQDEWPFRGLLIEVALQVHADLLFDNTPVHFLLGVGLLDGAEDDVARDRKSTRLNSSHGYISYAVFCLKKKNLNEPALRNYPGTRSGSIPV